MTYNGKELTEMTPEKWDGKSREMLVWHKFSSPSKKYIVGYTKFGAWADTIGRIYPHCAEIPDEEKVETIEELVLKTEELHEEVKKIQEEIEKLKEENERLKIEIDLKETIESLKGVKNEKKLRRMTYKELNDWLEQGKGVIKIAKHVSNTISYDYEDRNNEVYDGYKICGYDEDTWHEPMIEE